jgi:hypothetical protein
MDKNKPNPKQAVNKPGEVKKTTQHPSAEKKEQKPIKPSGNKY